MVLRALHVSATDMPQKEAFAKLIFRGDKRQVNVSFSLQGSSKFDALKAECLVLKELMSVETASATYLAD
jgi:hypothetical protein